MNSPTRFAVIGAGAIAGTWVQALADHPSAELIAISDSVKANALALSKVAKCDAYRETSQMLEKQKPDAVVICTPPASHAEIAELALAAGCHVICEKPLSISPEEAWRMVRAAEGAGKLLTMASKFRYVEDVVKAKSVVDSGLLGEIILFENAFTSRVDMSTRWNSDPAMSGGGVLIDNGTHSLDILRYFLGPIEELQVVEGKRSQNLAVEETVRVFARSTEGVMGSIDLSWSINKELDSYVNIYGTLGTIKVGWQQSQYRQNGGSEWVVFGNGYDKLQAFRSQTTNFCRAIRGEEPLLITARDGVASVEAVRAAYESLDQNHWTSVEDSQPVEVMQVHA